MPCRVGGVTTDLLPMAFPTLVALGATPAFAANELRGAASKLRAAASRLHGAVPGVAAVAAGSRRWGHLCLLVLVPFV